MIIILVMLMQGIRMAGFSIRHPRASHHGYRDAVRLRFGGGYLRRGIGHSAVVHAFDRQRLMSALTSSGG